MFCPVPALGCGIFPYVRLGRGKGTNRLDLREGGIGERYACMAPETAELKGGRQPRFDTKWNTSEALGHAFFLPSVSRRRAEREAFLAFGFYFRREKREVGQAQDEADGWSSSAPSALGQKELRGRERGSRLPAPGES